MERKARVASPFIGGLDRRELEHLRNRGITLHQSVEESHPTTLLAHRIGREDIVFDVLSPAVDGGEAPQIGRFHLGMVSAVAGAVIRFEDESDAGNYPFEPNQTCQSGARLPRWFPRQRAHSGSAPGGNMDRPAS